MIFLWIRIWERLGRVVLAWASHQFKLVWDWSSLGLAEHLFPSSCSLHVVLSMWSPHGLVWASSKHGGLKAVGLLLGSWVFYEWTPAVFSSLYRGHYLLSTEVIQLYLCLIPLFTSVQQTAQIKEREIILHLSMGDWQVSGRAHGMGDIVAGHLWKTPLATLPKPGSSVFPLVLLTAQILFLIFFTP